MTQGQVFEFGGHSYMIDLKGPVTTLLLRDDNTWVFVDTGDLVRWLEAHGQ